MYIYKWQDIRRRSARLVTCERSGSPAINQDDNELMKISLGPGRIS